MKLILKKFRDMKDDMTRTLDVPMSSGKAEGFWRKV